MPREMWTAPAALPLFSTSGASRTSSSSVLPLAIISRVSAGVIRGTAALAASIICLTLVAMTSSSVLTLTTIQLRMDPERQDCAKISHLAWRCRRGEGKAVKLQASQKAVDVLRWWHHPAASSGTRSHRRVGIAAIEREQSVGGAGDVEVEGEVLVDGEHIAQVPLQRIPYVEALRSVAGPQRLHRLARLVDGESGVRPEPQLGLEVGGFIALLRRVKLDGGLAQEIARRVDQAARPRHLDLHGLEVGDPRAGIGARPLRHRLEEKFVGAPGRAERGRSERVAGGSHHRDAIERARGEGRARILGPAAAAQEWQGPALRH